MGERLENLNEEKLVEINCLIPECISRSGFEVWNDKILRIPEFFIEETIREATDLGLPVSDVQFCVDFLLDRRKILLQLVDRHRAKFVGVKNDELFK